jgi:hypothetical protein
MPNAWRHGGTALQSAIAPLGMHRRVNGHLACTAEGIFAAKAALDMATKSVRAPPDNKPLTWVMRCKTISAMNLHEQTPAASLRLARATSKTTHQPLQSCVYRTDGKHGDNQSSLRDAVAVTSCMRSTPYIPGVLCIRRLANVCSASGVLPMCALHQASCQCAQPRPAARPSPDCFASQLSLICC